MTVHNTRSSVHLRVSPCNAFANVRHNTLQVPRRGRHTARGSGAKPPYGEGVPTGEVETGNDSTTNATKK
ncbi:hypothetical protein ACFLSV_07870 [Bacteroidota bacterium]